MISRDRDSPVKATIAGRVILLSGNALQVIHRRRLSSMWIDEHDDSDPVGYVTLKWGYIDGREYESLKDSVEEHKAWLIFQSIIHESGDVWWRCIDGVWVRDE